MNRLPLLLVSGLLGLATPAACQAAQAAEVPRVVFEPGSEAVAARAEAFLPEAVRIVEDWHGIRFREPVRVDVYATRASYHRHVVSVPGRGERASATGTVVSLSGKMREEIETTERVLVHELSHSLMIQHMGEVRQRTQLPKWFSEGLAVAASGGAGAEGVTEEEATAAVRAGRFVPPARSGSLLGLPTLSFAGLSTRLFYRQSGMFAAWLRARDEAAFRRFLESLAERPFAESFAAHLGAPIDALWSEFAASLATPE